MSGVKLHRWPVIDIDAVYVLAADYDRDTRALRYALDQWQCNSRENKRIAEENSARADKAEAERDQLRAQVAELKHQLETLRVEACKNDGK